jgi:uncharacterized phage protein (TIGR01671 family)
MQYTGLKDKNGKEIYEGDIIQGEMNQENYNLPHRGEVVYSDTWGAFATKNLGGTTNLHNLKLYSFEVIGNIHENPELMEELSDE